MICGTRTQEPATDDAPGHAPKALGPPARHRPAVFAVRVEDSRAREAWHAAWGAPVFTVEGRYRLGAGPSGRKAFSTGQRCCNTTRPAMPQFFELGRARTLSNHGVAPHPHRRPRSRLQQRQHLWCAVAARARGTDRGRTLGDALLRTRFEGQRCGSGAALDEAAVGGFIHSFNGAHSLFVDTIRSLRALALAHLLGHRLSEEQDAEVNLLERLVQHAHATAQYSVYYGRDRDAYDVRGRVSHEALFNVANGTYRGPSSQQGFSPFTTWTRGLAWAMLGFAELIEFLDDVRDRVAGRRGSDSGRCVDDEAARATCDFYIESCRMRGWHSVLGHRRPGPARAR